MSGEIKSRIRRVLSEKIQGVELADDAPLIEFGVGLDSIAALEFIVALEREFQIAIDEGEMTLEILATVNSIALHIESIVRREA
ncbi:MAG: acyl carrier protein [Deltaproteobacteria bacterium]